jgi:hypothetical protein
MTGKEKFVFDDKELGFEFSDFWRFHFSNIYDLQDKIAEFIVSKALGIDTAQNDQYWTLWDVSYRGKELK